MAVALLSAVFMRVFCGQLLSSVTLSWLRFRVCFVDIQNGCANVKWQVLTYSAGPIFVWSDA